MVGIMPLRKVNPDLEKSEGYEEHREYVTIPKKEYNSIKFHRKLLIISRIIAVLLVFAIIFIGIIQLKYVKEYNDLKNKYGNYAYCYMCGYELGKSCSCVYLPRVSLSEESRKTLLQEVAVKNTEICNRTSDRLTPEDIEKVLIQ